MDKKGVSIFSLGNVLSHSAKKFVAVTLVFQNYSDMEKKLRIRGGISCFSVEGFSFLSANKICRRTLLSFGKIVVLKLFMHRRVCHGFTEFFHLKKPIFS